MKWSVGLPGRDMISLDLTLNGDEIQTANLKGIGCTQLLDLLVEWRPKLKGPLENVPLPQANDHSSLLLRELLLQAQNKWTPPYTEQELCHCRAIPTERVNNAIISGCHTPLSVSKKTSASTACGTCRPDVQKQIQYFLETSKKSA